MRERYEKFLPTFWDRTWMFGLKASVGGVLLGVFGSIAALVVSSFREELPDWGAYFVLAVLVCFAVCLLTGLFSLGVLRKLRSATRLSRKHGLDQYVVGALSIDSKSEREKADDRWILHGFVATLVIAAAVAVFAVTSDSQSPVSWIFLGCLLLFAASMGLLSWMRRGTRQLRAIDHLRSELLLHSKKDSELIEVPASLYYALAALEQERALSMRQRVRERTGRGSYSVTKSAEALSALELLESDARVAVEGAIIQLAFEASGEEGDEGGAVLALALPGHELTVQYELNPSLRSLRVLDVVGGGSS